MYGGKNVQRLTLLIHECVRSFDRAGFMIRDRFHDRGESFYERDGSSIDHSRSRSFAKRHRTPRIPSRRITSCRAITSEDGVQYEGANASPRGGGRYLVNPLRLC